MDPLVEFLDGPRAKQAFVVRCVLESPWAIRLEDESPLSVVAMLRGGGWLLPLDGEGNAGDPVSLTAGDVLIARGPDHYVVADDPSTEPSIVIHPGQVCTTVDGRPLHETMHLGVRTWGNSATGETTMVVGAYLTDGEVSRMLLDALPAATVVRPADELTPTVRLLTAEAAKELPGQQVVLDRLLDLVLVESLRVAFSDGSVDVPAWFGASGDPVVGAVIARMHDDPTEPWTVASLAKAAGVSRALLARRFHELVGEPPMTFLTAWRMALAADRLLEPGATVGGVAQAVGYSSAFTFSAAFKRRHGVSPRYYRDRALASVAEQNRVG